jgi:hypothetical protein
MTNVAIVGAPSRTVRGQLDELRPGILPHGRPSLVGPGRRGHPDHELVDLVGRDPAERVPGCEEMPFKIRLQPGMDLLTLESDEEPVEQRPEREVGAPAPHGRLPIPDFRDLAARRSRYTGEGLQRIGRHDDLIVDRIVERVQHRTSWRGKVEADLRHPWRRTYG